MISGEVKKCSNGDPFPGVTVTVSKDGTELASTTTDENGTYYLSFLSNFSEFNVTGTYPGHNSSNTEILVGSTENNTFYGTADFKLGKATVYVSPSGSNSNSGTSSDKPYLTIEKAINEVSDGGTIYLEKGEYTGPGNVNLSINKSLTLSIYDGEVRIEDHIWNHILFNITSTNAINVKFIGLTLGTAGQDINGIHISPLVSGQNVKLSLFQCKFQSNDDGAIYNEGDLTIDGCTFERNRANFNYMVGGAIHNKGTLYIHETSFTGNTANYLGGAICNEGTLTIDDCSFTGNTATSGGAIFNKGTCIVNGCTFTDNTATGRNFNPGGGGISNRGTLTVNNSNFTGNVASYDGSAIWNNGQSTVNSCTFTTNRAESGAIWNTGEGTCNVYTCSFTGNTANAGGAIENYGKMSINHGTFSGNNATGLGGAISNYGKELIIYDSTFTSNTANYGGAISNAYDSNYGYHGPFSIGTSTFTSNTATKQGSVIYNGRDTETYEVHFNRIFGNKGSYDIYSTGGTINAENNWWGDNFNGTNPTTAGRVNSNVDADPWIVLRLSASPSLIGPGGTSTVTADLSKNSNGITLSGTLPNGTIHFSKNNGKLSPYDKTIGCYSVVTTFTAPNVPYIVQINSELDGFSVFTSIDVKVGTSLSVSAASGYKGDNTTLTATLWMANRPGSNAIVNFYVNGVYVGCGTTDANGVARYTYNITQNTGTYTINATFNTTTYYRASNGENTLTVDAIPTSLTVNGASGYKGDNTTLTATLWDTAHNKTVAGEKVDFYVNGAYIGQGTTNSNGIATCTYNIIQNIGTYTTNATFNTTPQHAASTGANTLTVDATPTKLTVDNVTGNRGTDVTLKATLTDTAHNVAISGKSVTFKVNGTIVGTVTTDANGAVTLPYYINLVGGNYTVDAVFDADDQYAGSSNTGTLKVPQSSIYVVVTSSKKDPSIGETFTLTYKLGNNGPDPAENVTITIPLPEGFELSNIKGDGNWTYNETTRTITWTFKNLRVGDPYLYITGKLSAAGNYLFSSSITADTYNINTEGVTPITINVKEQVNAASNTVAMQKTGTPINYLVLAVLMVLSGLLAPKRK